jgi:hypothetical protein
LGYSAEQIAAMRESKDIGVHEDSATSLATSHVSR